MKKLSVIFFYVILNVTYINAQVWKQYTTVNGLVNNSVKCLTQDNSGNLWIGTVGGVSKFSGTIFTNYTTVQGLPSNYVRTINCDVSGVV